ncbi:13050_t:CDS:2, partial [Racocetra fulgida]
SDIQMQSSTNPASSNELLLLKSQLNKIEFQYVDFLNEQQKSALLKKLNEILAVLATNLSKIKVSEKIVEKDQKLKVLLSSQILANDVDQIYDPK